jgi:hypothetical protein
MVGGRSSEGALLLRGPNSASVEAGMGEHFIFVILSFCSAQEAPKGSMILCSCARRETVRNSECSDGLHAYGFGALGCFSVSSDVSRLSPTQADGP